MKTDEADAIGGRAMKHWKADEIEWTPENCELLYKDPRPRVQWLLAMTYECARPTGRKRMEEGGYVYRPSESFPFERAWAGPPWPLIEFQVTEPETREMPLGERTGPLVYKAKVKGIKGLADIERTPANFAREFGISESSVRRMMGRVDRERAEIVKRLASMTEREKAEREGRRAWIDDDDSTEDTRARDTDGEPGGNGCR